MDIAIELCFILLILGLLLGMLNRWLPAWYCHKMGWHLEPTEKTFDGCSMIGKCPRCGKDVMQDIRGSWF